MTRPRRCAWLTAGNAEAPLDVIFLNHQSTDHLGGAERSLLTLIDRWVADDDSVKPTVVSPGPAPAMAREVERRGWRHVSLEFEGWTVFTANGGRAERRLRERSAAIATRQLIQLVRDTRAGLVVTNTLVHPWGAVAASATAVPHLWFVREFGTVEQGFLWLRDRALCLRDIGALSHRVIANSIAVRDDLAASIPADKLLVSYPPVDLEAVRARALRPRPGGAEPYPEREPLRICVLGRVTDSKGQWRVIDAVGMLAREGIRTQVSFVGHVDDHRLQTELLRRATASGTSISFAGEQENPFPFVHAAELCVIPSHQEAFGRTTLECLAIGRPVITTREGAGAELVTESVGKTISRDSVPSLAAAIRDYAMDRSLGSAQEAAARDRADELMSGPYAARVAVNAMAQIQPSDAVPLPPEWAAWLGRLDETADGGAPRRWRAQRATTRAATLLRKAIRDPRKAIARVRRG